MPSKGKRARRRAPAFGAPLALASAASPYFPPGTHSYQGNLEDIMGLAAGVILSSYDGTLVPKYMRKVLTHLSKWIPETGFVNGKSAPSTADCVILVLTQAVVPFGATLGDAAPEVYGEFPAAVALGERRLRVSGVAQAVEAARAPDQTS